MTKLSVNVNKIATLRNSRDKNNPDLLQCVLDIISFGAQGITVHPRPDERHIRHSDVTMIANAIEVEFNIEGFPDDRYFDLAKTARPAQCTLVPDPPDALTSNAGWEINNNSDLLRDSVSKLHDLDIRSSLFIDPFKLTNKELDALEKIGTDRVELYTEAYADAFSIDKAQEIIVVYQQAADKLNQLGIELNAGHDLNLQNLNPFIKAIPEIKEVSIGHALVCDALYLGLETTVKRYLDCLSRKSLF